MATEMEQSQMISLTTNTRGHTVENINPDFKNMSGPEQVAAYNNMAAKLPGVKPVKRFPDGITAIRRCNALATQLMTEQAKPSASASAVTAPTSETEPKPKETKVAKKAKAKKANGAAAVKDDRPKICQDLQTRRGSSIEKMVLVLHGDNFRKAVPEEKVLKAVYGSANKKNASALMSRARCITTLIKKAKMNLQVKKAKDDKGTVSYSLTSA